MHAVFSSLLKTNRLNTITLHDKKLMIFGAF